MTSHVPDELELLRAANPVSLHDLPDAPEDLYAGIDLGRSRRRRPTGRILIAAAAIGAVALGVALLPGRLADESRLGVVERALAAVSNGAVIHAIVENTGSRALLVDLASGEETVESERHEYWYDEQTGAIHARLTIGNEVLNEVSLARSSGPPPSHRALAFASRYREALESGQAHVVRWETVEGRRSPVLSIAVPPWRDPGSGQVAQPGYTEEVVVDGDSYKPLRFRHIYGADVASAPVFWWRVISIDAIDRDDEDFAAGPPPHRWTKFAPSNDKKVTVDEAASALGRTALWPGTEIDGVPLQRIGVIKTTITWTDGRETQSPSLMMRYETSGEKKRWLWMTVGSSPDETPRFGPVDGEAVPAGKVRLMQAGKNDHAGWFGNVQRDGVYINMQSPERELIVEAAKALTPLG